MLIISLLIQICYTQTISQFLALTPFQIQQLSITSLSQYFTQGSINGYLTQTELVNLIDKLTDSFPSYVTKSTIGTTYSGEKIKALKISATNSQKYQLIIIGMLYGNTDLISVNFLLFQLFYIVSSLSKSDYYITTLFADKSILFIPVVNLDGLKYISNYYTNSIIPTIQKNRHSSTCSNNNIGVNLGRNFQYKFGNNEIGSSSDQCNYQFRGINAFSESETQAIDKAIQSIRPNIIIVFGGDSNYLVAPEQSVYHSLLDSIVQQYNFQMGNYSKLYQSEINGDLCSNYIYAINSLCYTINIGQNTLNSSISTYIYLLRDILTIYTPSLIIGLYNQFGCAHGKLLCKSLESNEKGYIIILNITNVGYNQFQDNIIINIILNQGGEKLYQIDSYLLVNSINYTDTSQQSGISIDEISTSNVFTYQITNQKRLIQNQVAYYVFLITQFGFSYNYINTVDELNFTFQLSNTLQNTNLLVSVETTSLVSLKSQQELQSFIPNRYESYILLMCFAGISVIFFFFWCIRKIYFCIYDPTKFHDEQSKNGSSGEKHNDLYFPNHLIESRLNTQIKITQIAPSIRNFNDSPTSSKIYQSNGNIKDINDQQCIPHVNQNIIENKVQRALDIVHSNEFKSETDRLQQDINNNEQQEQEQEQEIVNTSKNNNNQNEQIQQNNQEKQEIVDIIKFQED